MKKRTLCALMALTMLLGTACSQDTGSDPVSENSSVALNDSSISENSSVPDADSSSESEPDSSASDVTTTATTTKNTSAQTSEISTSAAAQTDESKATSSSEAATTTTKQAAATQPAPAHTTKATVKTTTQATTKATTKATATASYAKPKGMTRLEDAVWELSYYGNNTNTKYLEIVREELLKYGQDYCKKNEKLKGYEINKTMYPYYDKNGKPLYAPFDKKGNHLAIGSDVEFPYDEHFTPFNYKTAEERLIDCRGFISGMHLYIERVLCNSMRHGVKNMQWYITYGQESSGMCWTVMSGFPEQWGKPTTELF